MFNITGCNCTFPNPSGCIACRQVSQVSSPNDFYYPYDIWRKSVDSYDKSMKEQINFLLNENIKLKQELFEKDRIIAELKLKKAETEAMKAIKEIAKKYNIEIDVK